MAAVVLVALFFGYRVSGGPVEVGTATAQSMAVNLILVTILTIGLVAPASAGSRDKSFFDGVQGQWSGPGEIVATFVIVVGTIASIPGATLMKQIMA